MEELQERFGYSTRRRTIDAIDAVIHERNLPFKLVKLRIGYSKNSKIKKLVVKPV